MLEETPAQVLLNDLVPTAEELAALDIMWEDTQLSPEAKTALRERQHFRVGSTAGCDINWIFREVCYQDHNLLEQIQVAIEALGLGFGIKIKGWEATHPTIKINGKPATYHQVDALNFFSKDMISGRGVRDTVIESGKWSYVAQLIELSAEQFTRLRYGGRRVTEHARAVLREYGLDFGSTVTGWSEPPPPRPRGRSLASRLIDGLHDD